MPCAYCSTSFSIIKWKNRCQVCMCQVCANCFTQKKCLPCYHVLASRMRYEALMKLKVKDLKLYSAVRHLPINSCKEKHELVQVILQNSVTSGCSELGHSDGFESSSKSQFQMAPSTESFLQQEPSNDVLMKCGANSLKASDVCMTSNDASVKGSGQSVLTVDRPIPTGKGNKLLISDITSARQINVLTSREMKQILTDNFVDYKGCVEKSELRLRIQNLFSDRLRNEERACEDEDTTCKICWDRAIDCVLLECGHMVTCTACGRRLNECPICRRFVVRCVHVFRS